MPNIAVLVPNDNVIECIDEILKEYPIDISEKIVINNYTAIAEAKRVIDNGIDIIISRGLQALLIRQHYSATVIDIAFTGQEVAMMIIKAKEIACKRKPRIAIICAGNLFCNMDNFSQIFDIELLQFTTPRKIEDNSAPSIDGAINETNEPYYKKIFTIEKFQDYKYITDEVIKLENPADVVIGGFETRSYFESVGIPYVSFQGSTDGVREAFELVSKVVQDRRVEEKRNTELRTILDYSFTGIIKTDNLGMIETWNNVAETLTGQEKVNLKHSHISRLMKKGDYEQIWQELQSGKSIFSRVIELNRNPVIANIIPVFGQGIIEIVILSFRSVYEIERMEAVVRKGLYGQDYYAKGRFEDFNNKSKAVKDLISRAKLFSCVDDPILIYGDTGTEKKKLAEAIHNFGSRKDEPFVVSNCRSMNSEEQNKIIFGKDAADGKSSFKAARNGTLVIEEIDALNPEGQVILEKIIAGESIKLSSGERFNLLNVRIIAISSKNLASLAACGSLRKELFFRINSLILEAPTLKDMEDDIGSIIESYVGKYCKQYSRFVLLTNGAKNALRQFDWKGNFMQLEYFCKRMVLTSLHKSVDEFYVRNLLQNLYPEIDYESGDSRLVIYKDPRAVKISELLEKYNGSREMVAKELDISLSTLWRHMKKFGVVSRKK